jgi:hypothetical protein
MPESTVAEIFPIGEGNAGIIVYPSAVVGEISTGGGGGAPVVDYHNAVWNTTNGEWVRWVTQGAADPNGVSYPGPGTFGVDTQTPAIVEFVE